MNAGGGARRYAMVALRRRDRAEALIALQDALDRSERIASEQARNRLSIEELEQRLSKGTGGGNTKAGRLARHIEHMRLTKTALRKQRQTKVALAAASEENAARIDAAKERVANSQKALRALDAV